MTAKNESVAPIELPPESARLLELLGDENPETRWAAIAALVKLGPAALPALVQAIEEGSGYQTFEAVDALARLGTVAAPAVAALLPLLGRSEA